MLNSAANVLRALDYLVEHDEGGVSEIAQHLDVTVGTGHRILVTLVETGYAEQNPHSRRYRPSSKIIALAHQMRGHVNIRDRVHLHLVELMQSVRESVHLGVLENNLLLYIDKVASDQAYGVEFRVGSRLPVHCTALGWVLAAFQERSDVAEFLRAGRTWGRGVTTPTARAFSQDLRTVRAEGIAEDRGEYVPDVRCVAAPIRAARGDVIAAVDIAVPRSRFDDARESLRDEVRRCAERISEQLRQLDALGLDG